MTFQHVKNDLDNYSINLSMMQELFEELKVNTKMSQTISDMPRGKNSISDSVSSEVFRRLVLKERIKMINERIEYIDEAIKRMDGLEKQIMEYVKNGYSITRIAVLVNRSRPTVTNIRNKGIRKIVEYYNIHTKLHN